MREAKHAPADSLNVCCEAGRQVQDGVEEEWFDIGLWQASPLGFLRSKLMTRI